MTEHGEFRAMLARRRELKTNEAAALQDHLDHCPECRIVEREYATQDDLLHTIPPPAPWFPMERRVLAQIHRQPVPSTRRRHIGAFLFAWQRSGPVLLLFCGLLVLNIAMMVHQTAHTSPGLARAHLPGNRAAQSASYGRYGPVVDSAAQKLAAIRLPSTVADSAALIAAPNEGHGGSAVYLSGTGFAPQTKLGLAVSCPGSFFADAVPGRNASSYVVGTVVTNRHGSFAGRMFQMPALQDARTSGCEIHASGSGGQHTEAPAVYVIVPTAVPTARCARTICISVTSKRSAGQSLLAVHAWPGARGTISVMGAAAPLQQLLQFDWQGLALVSLGPTSALQKRRLSVHVTARLRNVSGTFAETISQP